MLTSEKALNTCQPPKITLEKQNSNTTTQCTKRILENKYIKICPIDLALLPCLKLIWISPKM